MATRRGYEATIAAAITVLLAGLGLRVAHASVVALFAGTLLVGIAIAVLGTALPGVVKTYFPHRAGAVTGLYSAGLGIGASAAGAVSVPISVDFGSWRVALLASAVPAAVGLLAWLPVLYHARASRVVEPAPRRRAGQSPWRRPIAWGLSAFLMMQTTAYYGIVGWLAPAFIERGWTPDRAGFLLAAFGIAGIVSGVAIPMLADRIRDHRPVLASTVGGAMVGMVLLAFAPDAAPWPTTVLLGLTLGGAFPLALVLVVRIAPDPASAGRLSAMVFATSFPVAALAQVLFAALHDRTGSWAPVFTTLIAVTAVQFVASLLLHPGSTRQPRHARRGRPPGSPPSRARHARPRRRDKGRPRPRDHALQSRPGEPPRTEESSTPARFS